MGNDNENNEELYEEVNKLHNLFFFIIIALLCAILYFAYKTYDLAANPVNVGSLKHYDSIYSERRAHYSMDGNGNITGYTTPDGLYYIFEEPIPDDKFFNY